MISRPFSFEMIVNPGWKSRNVKIHYYLYTAARHGTGRSHILREKDKSLCFICVHQYICGIHIRRRRITFVPIRAIRGKKRSAAGGSLQKKAPGLPGAH